MGANHRSWLGLPETSSRIPIFTALSKSFFVCVLNARGEAITLDVRFAFMVSQPSLSSTVIFGTFIIGSCWVWQMFIELALNCMRRKDANVDDRSPSLFSNASNICS